jgi:hypothetical protein
MALDKALTGIGDAVANYHMINTGSIDVNLVSNLGKIRFTLSGFKDANTRLNNPNAGTLRSSTYVKDLTHEQIAHIIDYLGLYPYVKEVDSDFADALDV